MELKPSVGVQKVSSTGVLHAVSSTSLRKKKLSYLPYDDHPTTSYLETLMHLLKGNVGTGCFAMADAIKNGGLLMGPIFTLIIGVICVHTQHMLIQCAEYVREENALLLRPDYAVTVQLSFLSSRNEKVQKWAPTMKKVCDIFICITQLGFCCVYLLFVGTNLKDVFDFHGIKLDLHIWITLGLIPIWLTTMIRTLKFISIFSAIANFCMIVGVIMTVGFISRDLPPLGDRKLVGELEMLPVFFGTVLFTYEGIALVLPLQNAMERPHNFAKTLGVLNVGMVIATAMYIIIGIVGYWAYGEQTLGSLTLNLPTESMLAQAIKIIIVLGVLLGYAIQFFVAIQIMFSAFPDSWTFANNYPVLSELVFRTLMVLITFVVAQIVPNLSLLLSLIGAVCCTVIAFVFPAILELIVLSNRSSGIGWWCWLKNSVILLIAFAGFLFGGGINLKEIVQESIKNFK